MDKRLLCVKAYYKYLDDPDSKIGIATRFFNLPILTQAHHDILEMYIMDMEEMGYAGICLILMNHDMEILETIGY